MSLQGHVGFWNNQSWLQTNKSLQFLVISRLQNRFFVFLWPTGENDTCIRGDQISHYTKYGGLERPHKSGKRSYSYAESRLKHKTEEFHSIQQFWLQLDIVSWQKRKRKFKMRRPETGDFFFWPKTNRMFLLPWPLKRLSCRPTLPDTLYMFI